MNQYGSVRFALVAKMAAYREVQADGVLVNSKGLYEVLDRLVGIIGKEELEAIFNRFLVGNRCL